MENQRGQALLAKNRELMHAVAGLAGDTRPAMLKLSEIEAAIHLALAMIGLLSDEVARLGCYIDRAEGRCNENC